VVDRGLRIVTGIRTVGKLGARGRFRNGPGKVHGSICRCCFFSVMIRVVRFEEAYIANIQNVRPRSTFKLLVKEYLTEPIIQVSTVICFAVFNRQYVTQQVRSQNTLFVELHVGASTTDEPYLLCRP
jgi:hypothetical protein